MRTHTNDFKNEIKRFGRELDSKITYGTTELGKEQLNSVTPHYESSLLKSVMKQLDIDSNVEIPLETVINYQFGVKVGNSYEYLNYGNYVVYKAEKQEDTKSWKITCYDKMLYAMKDYESLGVTYPITIKNFLSAICTKLGLTLASDDFVNADKEILNELYLDSDGNDLGYTYRDVLDEIAQVVAGIICINNDDEVEVRYPSNVGEYETVEGTKFYLENVDDTDDFSYELKGDTVQDGTPSPDSPVEVQTIKGRQEIKVVGKNLLNTNLMQEFSPASTNWYSLDGVQNFYNATNIAKSKIYYDFEYGKTYTISIKKLVNTSGLQFCNTSGTVEIRDITGNTTYTPTQNIRLYPRIRPSEVATTQAIIQLEVGSTASEYEEYTEQSYEINLGKNFFDKSSFTSRGNYTKNDSGTEVSTQGFSYSSSYTEVLPNTVYTLSGNLVNNRGQVRIYYYNNSKNWISRSAGFGTNVNTCTFTTPSNCCYIQFQYITGVFNVDTIQIEKGSTKTNYASYKTPIELCKIGDYQDFIRKGTGKNLFDGEIELGGINPDDGTLTSSNYRTRSKNFIKVKPNTTYSFSRQVGQNRWIIGYTKDKVGITDGETGHISSIAHTGTGYNIVGFTTTPTTEYIKWYDTNSTNLQEEVQLELGNQVTEYEPYGFKDKWYIHKEIGKVVLDGSEDGWGNDSQNKLCGLTINDIISNAGTSTIISSYCSNYRPASLLNARLYEYDFCIYSYKLWFNNQGKSLADFKTWVSSNNMEVYYPLALPTTNEITDTELINQLESVRLQLGIDNVSVNSANLSSPLKLTYLSELETIDEEMLKNVNVNFGDKFGPVNSVVLSRSAESDNIYRKDDESVELNGLTEIKIKDNQILNGNNRDDFIDGIFDKLKGLEYYVNDYVSTGIAYLELGDIYKVKVENNSYKCLMLNDELDVTQGLEEPIHAERMEDSETDYTKADKTDRKINQTYLIVDKQNQEINSVVQNVNTLQTVVNSQGEQIDSLGTRITQNIDSITASVSSIQSELDNGVSLVKTTSVIVNDEGLTVATDTSKTQTIMTSDKFIVRSGGKDLAYFGYDDEIGSTKAQMDNLTVTNYFVAGYHRTEKMEENGEHRTGVFYIGG